MVTIKLSNSDYQQLLVHLTTAYEHYQEYSYERDAENVQLLTGAIVFNSETT